MIDISDYKKTAEKLHESDRRFQLLSENIHEVFWLISNDRSNVFYVSPAYEKIWGRSCRFFYEDPRGGYYDAIFPDDRPRVLSDTRKEPDKEYEMEYRIVLPDKTIRWVRERVIPLRNESGNVYRIAGIVSDTTAYNRLLLESDFRRQQVIHSDRLSSLGKVVAGVAHEINNPNSFITYNIPLLQETWEMFKPLLLDYGKRFQGWSKKGVDFEELMQDMEEIIEAIRIGSDRINRVVENLTDFVRQDKTTITQSVNLKEVVERTLVIVGGQLRKTVNKIDSCFASDLPSIQGDPQKLEQVVANLLINASQAVRDETKGRISITTRYIERLRAVTIEIEDNGIGMDQVVINRLFEPFFTNRWDRGGTGLGLSVSYGLVKEHGGKIGVLSRPGIGSRFTVYLPIDRKTQLDFIPTILCVNDDHSALKLINSKYIEEKEVRTILDVNPESVFTYLRDHPEIDMVLCNDTMAELNGWQLLKMIKTRHPLISVILLSDHPNELQKKTDNAIQPDECLAKPFGTEELLLAINRIGRQRI